MTHYTQLTQEQRYHISGLLKAGTSKSNIADEVGVHKSTISREIKRNSGERGYRPKQADQFATERRQQADKHIKFTTSLKQIVTEKIMLDWSPDQISGYLKRKGIADISHERIS